MRFGAVVDRNTAILMVEEVSHDVAQIPATEERESRSTFSLLDVFLSLIKSAFFLSFSHEFDEPRTPEAWFIDLIGADGRERRRAWHSRSHPPPGSVYS